MNKKIKSPLIILVILVLILSLAFGCSSPEQPIKIGFSGTLTGRLSEFGVSGRNGVILAVEEVNNAGGINGRTVELLTKDDKNDSDVAMVVDRELINEEVVAIIGHMTSTPSAEVAPLMNKEQMLMISPTAATNSLTGLDDFFLRVFPANKPETDKLAEYAFKKLGVKRVVSAFDISNPTFTQEWHENFQAEFEALGGECVLKKPFDTRSVTSFLDITQELISVKPDAIVISASAIDTAAISQQLRKLNQDIPVISSTWAMTDDFLQHSGPAGEGVLFAHPLKVGNQDEGYLSFAEAYTARFGNQPSFSATFGYEAARILMEALASTDNHSSQALKDYIVEKRTFQGLQGEFVIDRFGDAVRDVFMITVREGQFIRVEQDGK